MSFDPIAYINEPRQMADASPGLQRISALLEHLGNPHEALRFVHIAGTNGKGSTATLLASILTEAGYKTGLFTSPYIFEFNERIRINGDNIPDLQLAKITQRVAETVEQAGIHPTGFELMVGVSFTFFAQEKCDIVVCEAGLGGRFDATNVIESPELSIITRIGMDHMETLGNTPESIANEKAGIIKHGIPVVSWPHEPEVRAVLEKRARGVQTEVSYPDFDKLIIEKVSFSQQTKASPTRTFSYKGSTDFELQLIADYQAYNAALTLEAVFILQQNGWEIPERALREGLFLAITPGRFEIIGNDPLFIIDGAHNVQAVRAFTSAFTELMGDVKPVFIIGILEDKEFSAMLEEVIGLGSAFIAVCPPSPRGLSVDTLAQTIYEVWQSSPQEETAPLTLNVASSFEEAVDSALEYSEEQGVVCSFGSMYSIAALRNALV